MKQQQKRKTSSRLGSVCLLVVMLFLSFISPLAAQEEQVEVSANGDTAPAGSDCAIEVQAALAPLQAANTELKGKLDTTIEELDEIIEERNRLLEEIKRTRESLHASRTEKESLRESLQATKTAKDELQQRLLNAQSQVSTLTGQLDAARAEIIRLNEMSFVVQFRNEVVALWDQMREFARTLVTRDDQEEA